MKGRFLLAMRIIGCLFPLEIPAGNDLQGKLKHALKPDRLFFGEVGHANRILKLKVDKNGKIVEFDYVM